MPRDCEICGKGANNRPPFPARCGKHGGVTCAAGHNAIARDKSGRLPFCQWHGPDLCLFPGCAELRAGASQTCKKHVSDADTAVAAKYAQDRQAHDRSVRWGETVGERFVEGGSVFVPRDEEDEDAPCCGADGCANDAEEGSGVCEEHAGEAAKIKKRNEETLATMLR